MLKGVLGVFMITEVLVGLRELEMARRGNVGRGGFEGVGYWING